MIERLNRFYLGIGVDLQKAFTKHFHFGSADGSMCGRQLAVGVRGLHYITIHDGEMSQTGTNEALGGKGTDTSDTEDDDALCA